MTVKTIKPVAQTPEQKQLAATKKKVDALKPKIQAGVKLSPAELKLLDDFYGPIANLIASNKDILGIFQTALKNEQDLSSMGVQAFQKAVKNSNWYSQRTTNQRNYDTFTANPRNAKDLASREDAIRRAVENSMVQNLGLSAAGNEAKIEQITKELSRDYYSNWSDNVDRLTASKFSNLKATEFGGQIATKETQIRQYYRSMGLPIDDSSISNYTADILMNKTNLDTIQAQVRKSAANMWGQFSDRINSGETVDNILYPYKQLISSMLEVDPESLDMTRESKNANSIDPLLQKALFSSADGKGVMSLTDLRKAAKQDSRWQFTKNAKDEYSNLTTELMRTFGAGV